MKTSFKFLVLPLAVGALIFAGCGSDDSSSDNSTSDTSTTQSQPADTSGSTETIALAADPSGALAYDTDKLSAKAGNLTLAFTNEAAIPHDVVIQDSSGKTVAETDTITGSSTSTAFTAKPGTYTFFCSLPGHEAAGMKGTLTVK